MVTRRIRAKFHRTRRGASMILVVACAIILGLALWAAFQFILVEGGSREVRNAVDAAALNIARHAPDMRTGVDPLFRDVADTTGRVGMSNINRVWGKAYLINANVQEMKMNSQIGNAAMAGETAYGIAEQANNGLLSQLANRQQMDPYFNAMAVNRGAKLLGNGATVTTDSQNNAGFSTSMVDRGAASNLQVSQLSLPQGAQVPQRGKWVTGYMPFQANGHNFTMAALPPGEMPHLIADQYFLRNSNLLPNTVPNAFKEAGAASGGSASLSAFACAEANPMQQYTMTIPHAYASILIQNVAVWKVQNPKGYATVKVTTYGNAPEEQYQVKHFPLPPPPDGPGGFLDGYAQLGMEYKAGNLWMTLNSHPNTNYQLGWNKLLQRLREINPTFSMAQLQQLLQSASTTAPPNGPGIYRYYIYPVFQTADCSDMPQFKVGTNAGNLPPWMNPNSPDGFPPVPVLQETTVRDEPNYCWENIVGGKINSGPHWTDNNGTVSWIPGTGLSQSLGELRFNRQTVINLGYQ